MVLEHTITNPRILNENESTTNVNTSLEKVEHILITTAKRRLKIKSVKRHKSLQSSSNKKWFDKECRPF